MDFEKGKNRQESPENDQEAGAEKEKVLTEKMKAFMAISAGVLWLEKAVGVGLSKKEEEEYNEDGILKMAGRRMSSAYKGINKLDKALSEGSWGELFGEDKKTS